jgi:predicted Rossmann-fold nucleotide-binding protein
VTRSLDIPSLDRIDTLAQELAMLQDRSKRRIAILGSRHVPVVSIHLVELVARSLAQEGHNLITSGAQGVNAAVIRSVSGDRSGSAHGAAAPEPRSSAG